MEVRPQDRPNWWRGSCDTTMKVRRSKQKNDARLIRDNTSRVFQSILQVKLPEWSSVIRFTNRHRWRFDHNRSWENIRPRTTARNRINWQSLRESERAKRANLDCVLHRRTIALNLLDFLQHRADSYPLFVQLKNVQHLTRRRSACFRCGCYSLTKSLCRLTRIWWNRHRMSNWKNLWANEYPRWDAKKTIAPNVSSMSSSGGSIFLLFSMIDTDKVGFDRCFDAKRDLPRTRSTRKCFQVFPCFWLALLVTMTAFWKPWNISSE